MDQEHSQMALQAVSHAAEMASYAIQNAAASYDRYSVLMRPKLYIDGDQWCALYGDNIQDGVAGFGTSPAKALENFDKNFIAAL